MSTSFVPFLPQSAANGQARSSFQQLKAGAAVSDIPAGTKEAALAATLAVQPAVVSGMPHQHAAPQVTLQRDGDKVTGIRVECGCGQVILLDCVY